MKLSKTLIKRSVSVLLIAAALFVFKEQVYDIYIRQPDAALNPDPNHHHIDWALWIDGKQIDFSDNQYMSGLSTSDESHDEEHEYLHKHLHLHDNVSHVVHRHKAGLTLLEFVESLGFQWNKEKGCLSVPLHGTHCNDGDRKWRMLINKEEVAFDLDWNFGDLDKVLLSYGAIDTEIQKQWKKMTDDACLYSWACRWRGDPPEENCIADPTLPCIAPLD